MPYAPNPAAEEAALYAARRDHLDAQLDQYRGTAAPTWRPADLLEAHAQVVAVMAGARPPSDLHPLAVKTLDATQTPTLLGLARAAVVARFGDRARGWDDRQILASGVGTDHLSEVLAEIPVRVILNDRAALLGAALRAREIL